VAIVAVKTAIIPSNFFIRKARILTVKTATNYKYLATIWNIVYYGSCKGSQLQTASLHLPTSNITIVLKPPV